MVEEDLLSFLRGRNIPESVINELEDDKVNKMLRHKKYASYARLHHDCLKRFWRLPVWLQVDTNVITVMTDGELGQYIARCGDRLALKSILSSDWRNGESLLPRTENTVLATDSQSKSPDGLRWDGSTLREALITKSEHEMEAEHGICRYRNLELWASCCRQAKSCFLFVF